MNFLWIVFRWWIVVFGIGIVTFPIAFWLLSRFWDRGWALSRILGVALLTYWVFTVGNLRIFRFEVFTILFGITIIAYFSYLVWFKVGKNLRQFVKDRWRLLVFEEFLFGASFLGWSWVRAHQPDIHGLEKFMDFGFLNSIMRASFFPPADMWLVGETINYYYFGHLATAVVTKLSGLSTAISYNLAIATLLGLTFAGAFSLGSTVVEHLIPSLKNRQQTFFLVLAGLISAFVIAFAGNLHTVITILSEGVDSYWYPDATRYIPYTIHEFPIYSFVVSDLHGHVSNIPFVILTLSMLLALLIEYSGRWRFSFFSPTVYWRLIGLGFMLGILYMTNALDAPIYLTLIGAAFFAFLINKLPFKKLVLTLGISLGVVVSSSFLLSLPFHLNFVLFTKGVELVHARSSILQLMILWGFFLFVGSVFLLLTFFQRFYRLHRVRLFDAMISRLVFVLIVVSLVLVIIPEFIYFIDIYIAEYHRANTMFKLVYQTFVLMSLVTGPVFVCLLWYFLRNKNAKLRIFLFILLMVFTLGLESILSYPYFAVRSYYNRFHTFYGLNGISWLSRAYPDDFAAIVWLNEEVVGQPVLVEAVGESYTDFARVSANTGLPTVLGWRVHEWLWRGSFDKASLRTGEVESLYTSGNIRTVCSIVNKYNIEYVFIGALEREKYPELKEDSIKRIGDLVFSQGDTQIYRIRKPCGDFLFKN